MERLISETSTISSYMYTSIVQNYKFKLNILIFPSCFIEVEENKLKLQKKIQKELRGEDDVKR